MKRLYLLFLITECTILAIAQSNLAKLSLSHIEETQIQQSDIIQSDTLISLNYPQPITGLSVSGTAILDHPSNSLVRITLQDDYNTEWLVYELYPLLADSSTVTFDNVTFETSVLDNITAKQLNIKVINASLQLDNINISDRTVANYSTKQSQVLEAQSSYIINKLNENLEKRNIPWRAGETSISQMTYEEKKAMFGGEVPNLGGFEYYKGGIFVMPNYKQQTADNGIATISATEEEDPYVQEWDWRNRHGKNWMTPVKFQAACNSCWAFAAAGTLEAYINLYYNQLLNIDLSEQELVSCAPTPNGGKGCDGNNFFYAADYIKENGIINEEAFPYTATNNNCSNKSSNPTERFFITGYTDNLLRYPQNIPTIKRELFTSPLAITILDWNHDMVLTGYKTLKEGDVISLPGYQTDTLRQGDSAIGKTALLVKNSYGDWWGEDGYGYILPNDSFSVMLYRFEGELRSINYNNSNIVVTDNDEDGHYFKGINQADISLPRYPGEIDYDDSDSDYAKINQYGHMQEIEVQTYNITSYTPSSYLFPHKDFWGMIHYNVVVKDKGKLLIDENLKLYKDATITIESGGTLEVSGCTLEQADITVRSGGALVLSNEGNLLLKTNDSMTAELGSTVTINPDCSICVEK